MIINQHNSTAIITQDKTSLPEFLKKFSVLHERFKKNDVILVLKDELSSGASDQLVTLSHTHRHLNYSFVVVTTQLNQDDFEDDLIIVPSLQEAHDYIEMELMQRDLGF